MFGKWITALALLLVLTCGGPALAGDGGFGFGHESAPTLEMGLGLGMIPVEMDPGIFNYHIVDDFGDDYYFTLNQPEVGPGVPVLKGWLSSELVHHFDLILEGSLGMDEDLVFWSAGAGLAPSISLGRLELQARALALVQGLSYNFDTVQAAYPGDPGFAYEGEWYEVGTPVTASALTYGLVCGGRAALHLPSNVVLALDYSYYALFPMSKFRIHIEDLDIIGGPVPNPVTLRGRSVTLSLGVSF